MGVTISTHNGSAVAREHNIRNRKVTDKEEHIDPNGIHEIWVDEKPKAAYQRLFGKAVDDYNAKQKRSDRKITDYYQQICNDKKKHPVYEMIIAVGDRTDYAIGNLDENTAKSILREFVDGWQERNPHLVLIGAYYHADEQGVPHAHLDYIPVANGYKRGLETQSALVKALEQQGFSKDGKETAQIQWERRENAHLESLCLSNGIDVIHPRIAERQHLDTSLYQLEQDVKTAEKQISEYRNKNFGLELQKDSLRREKDELELIVGQLSDYHEILKRDIAEAENREQAAREKVANAEKQLAEVRQARQEVEKLRSEVSALRSEKSTLTDDIVELKLRKQQVGDYITEYRKSVADIEKLEHHPIRTAEQWVIKLGAEKRKFGSGYIIPEYEIHSLARKFADFDKKIKAMASEIRSLTYDNQQLRLGYTNPLDRCQEKLEQEKKNKRLAAFEKVVGSLPEEVRTPIERAINEYLNPAGSSPQRHNRHNSFDR